MALPDCFDGSTSRLIVPAVTGVTQERIVAFFETLPSGASSTATKRNTVQHNVFTSNFPYRGLAVQRFCNCLIDRSIFHFHCPRGRPNRGLPPRSSLNVNAQPDAVGVETVIRIAYLVPPTPSPVISRSRGGSTSRTVHVTLWRSPRAPRHPQGSPR